MEKLNLEQLLFLLKAFKYINSDKEILDDYENFYKKKRALQFAFKKTKIDGKKAYEILTTKSIEEFREYLYKNKDVNKNLVSEDKLYTSVVERYFENWYVVNETKKKQEEYAKKNKKLRKLKYIVGLESLEMFKENKEFGNKLLKVAKNERNY